MNVKDKYLFCRVCYKEFYNFSVKWFVCAKTVKINKFLGQKPIRFLEIYL